MPQLAAGAADSGAPAVSSALLAGAVGGGLLGLVLLVTIAVIVRALFRRLSGFKLPLTLKPVVYALDLFSPMRPINVGSDRVLAERDKSTLGFSMTLLAVGTLSVLAAVLGASRANANTLVQQSLGPLEGPLLEATAGWPFATAPVPGLPGEANGLFLRFTASGEPRACLPLAGSLQFSGLKAGAWALLPPPACAGGAFDQFTLQCASCLLTSAAALSFTLPFSCQSILAEAGAVDASGVFSVVALEPASGGAGGLLTSLKWTLSPLMALLNDTLDGARSRRGWKLLSLDAALGPPQQLLPAAGAGGLLALQPLFSGVRVSVSLSLQPYAATTALKELTSVLQLLSSIAGFQAPVFALVGLLFGLLSAKRKQARPRSERGAAPLADGKQAPSSSPQWQVENPLARLERGSGGVVLHSFAAVDEETLSISVGQRVVICALARGVFFQPPSPLTQAHISPSPAVSEKDSQGWVLVFLEGAPERCGLVPASYIRCQLL